MEQIVTVEETQIKDKKCILLRIKGGKQFVLQCEVGQCPLCQVSDSLKTSTTLSYNHKTISNHVWALQHGHLKL